MRTSELIQYILLIVGITVFFGLTFLFIRDHRRTEVVGVEENTQLSENEGVEEREVSDFFDGSFSEDDDFGGSDPFAKYCDGNEGSINSFTVCARD